MTTSYELSLKLKELGVEQNFGEYYWYMVYGTPMELHPDNLMAVGHDKICRAFTLGELVRMIGNGITISLVKDEYHFAWHDLTKTSPFFNKTQIPRIVSKFNKIPEECAAELAIELVKSGVIKFETNQKEG